MTQKYQPNRGGHAPGNLREPLLDYLLDGEGEPNQVRWLIGQLWNCTDIVPGDCCTELDIGQGSTYAQAVRKMAINL